jgi:hypothetical protein
VSRRDWTSKNEEVDSNEERLDINQERLDSIRRGRTASRSSWTVRRRG